MCIWDLGSPSATPRLLHSEKQEGVDIVKVVHDCDRLQILTESKEKTPEGSQRYDEERFRGGFVSITWEGDGAGHWRAFCVGVPVRPSDASDLCPSSGRIAHTCHGRDGGGCADEHPSQR